MSPMMHLFVHTIEVVIRIDINVVLTFVKLLLKMKKIKLLKILSRINRLNLMNQTMLFYIPIPILLL